MKTGSENLCLWDDKTKNLALRLAKGAGQSYAMIKNALNQWPMALDSFLELEAVMQAVAFSTQDFEEGRKAFLGKRPPFFKGK